MKKILIFFALASYILMGCDSENNESTAGFAIDAEFAGVPDSVQIYLQLVENKDLKSIDSAYLVDSRVSFKGELQSPQMVYLRVGESRKMVNFFGENSNISVRVNIDSLAGAKITGSRVHDQFMDFKAYMRPIDERSEELDEAYQEARMNGDKEKMNDIIKQSDQLWSDQIDLVYSFLDDKYNSYISPFIIRQYLVFELDYEGLDSLLAKIGPDFHNSDDYKSLSDRLEVLKKVAVGQPALDFTLNDPHGNPIAISSFRGDYLLIDFWASWCGSCRVENPNIVKLYQDFNKKGFEILGVSLDKDRERWLAAIESDGLVWSQVSDLQFWNSAAGKLYGINSIPSNVLVNREGIIVARNLQGDALRKKIEELYAAEEQNI